MNKAIDPSAYLPTYGPSAAAFLELCEELDPHLAKEEQVPFPMVVELEAAGS